MNLSPNQIQLCYMTGGLLAIWSLLCWGIALGFGLVLGLSILAGGLIHGLAVLVQGSYYFAYRGAAETAKMVSALGWGMLMKFLIIIVISSLLLYFVPSVNPLGLIGGILSMHLLHNIGMALWWH